MKRRRRLLRLRDKVVAEETEKYEELKNELKRKGILWTLNLRLTSMLWEVKSVKFATAMKKEAD